MRRNWSRTGGNFFFQDLSNRGEKLNRGTNSSIDRGTCNDGEGPGAPFFPFVSWSIDGNEPTLEEFFHGDCFCP